MSHERATIEVGGQQREVIYPYGRQAAASWAPPLLEWTPWLLAGYVDAVAQEHRGMPFTYPPELRDRWWFERRPTTSVTTPPPLKQPRRRRRPIQDIRDELAHRRRQEGAYRLPSRPTRKLWAYSDRTVRHIAWLDRRIGTLQTQLTSRENDIARRTQLEHWSNQGPSDE